MITALTESLCLLFPFFFFFVIAEDFYLLDEFELGKGRQSIISADTRKLMFSVGFSSRNNILTISFYKNLFSFKASACLICDRMVDRFCSFPFEHFCYLFSLALNQYPSPILGP